MTETLELNPDALAELFPTEPVQPTTAPNSETQQTQTAGQPAVTPTVEDIFVKSPTGTVYKTREAAEQGIAQKDALIEQMRQRIALATGIDPISQRPIQALTDNRVESYQTNKRKYAQDLKGVTTDEQLVDIQTQFVLDALAPLAPAITAATREQALTRTEAEVPGFRKFYGSADYQATLARVPDLKEAIEAAEGDIKFHTRLPGLYKVAQLVSQGIQLPELLKKAQPSTQPLTPQRPTNTAATLTPPTTTTVQPGLDSKAGRQAIIEAFEKTQADKVLNW